MRKNIARKCLCIALASAMMLGEAGTAMAASVENVADGKLKNDGDGYYFHT